MYTHVYTYMNIYRHCSLLSPPPPQPAKSLAPLLPTLPHPAWTPQSRGRSSLPSIYTHKFVESAYVYICTYISVRAMYTYINMYSDVYYI